jgi:hypothetical protein
MTRLLQDCWNTLRKSLGTLLRRVSGHRLFERYGLLRKPAGWNRAVLGYFHRGPELREPGGDYRAAFRERANRP